MPKPDMPMLLVIAALIGIAPAQAQLAKVLKDPDTQAKASQGSALRDLFKPPQAVLFGSAANGGVLFSADCSGFVPGVYASCVTPVAGSTVNFDRRDLGNLSLPARRSRTLLCPMLSNRYVYNLMNSTTATANGGSVSFDPYFTIESAALSDPAAIDPDTGLPFNGSLDVSAAAGLERGTNNLRPGLPESESGYISRSCIGGFTPDFFVAAYGLSQALAEKLVSGALTIRLNLRGNVTNLRDGSYLIGVRVFTD
ncbi:MAG: hypothetical protein ACREVL_15655 [Solimonas sp.]